MSIIQGTIKTSQISKKEFVSVYFKISGSAVVTDEWIQIEIPNTPAEGLIKRARATLLSGDATLLNFFVSEDNSMLIQDTVVKYENIDLTTTHLDSEEAIYYNLIQRSETNYSLGTMYVYIKSNTAQNNIWYRLDIMEVG
jgi:hypothetical protein